VRDGERRDTFGFVLSEHGAPIGTRRCSPPRQGQMRPKGSFSFLGNEAETAKPLDNLLLHSHNVTNAMLQAKPEHTR
jgi:hypothetical protein